MSIAVEVHVIPVKGPGKLERCREPGPISASTFTDAEEAKVRVPGRK